MPEPFSAVGDTQTLAPNNTSVNADIANLVGADRVLVSNPSEVVCFARVQSVTGAGNASAANVPILGGSQGILKIRGDQTAGGTRVSVFAASSATVYVTPGVGGI